MVADASLLSAQHMRTCLASLSSQTSLKKKTKSICNELLRVIYTSWNKLLCNQP